jgi:hypothetical protein
MKINTPCTKVPNKKSRNKIIPSIQKLTQLEECFISPCQIYKLKGYGQYKMHGSVINVPTNVDQTQSILPHLPHDGATLSFF